MGIGSTGGEHVSVIVCYRGVGMTEVSGMGRHRGWIVNDSQEHHQHQDIGCADSPTPQHIRGISHPSVKQQQGRNLRRVLTST